MSLRTSKAEEREKDGRTAAKANQAASPSPLSAPPARPPLQHTKPRSKNYAPKSPKTVHARTHPPLRQCFMPKHATRAIGRSPQSPLQKKLQTRKKSYGKNRKKHPHIRTHPQFRQCLIPSRLRPARQKTPHPAPQKKLRPRPAAHARILRQPFPYPLSAPPAPSICYAAPRTRRLSWQTTTSALRSKNT